MDHAKLKIVYTVATRTAQGHPPNGAPIVKKYWNRVGIAFVNADGSLSVKLEALPVSGELQIRDYVPDSSKHGAQTQPKAPAARAA
jgi:hypothetical protein